MGKIKIFILIIILCMIGGGIYLFNDQQSKSQNEKSIGVMIGGLILIIFGIIGFGVLLMSK